MTVGTNSANGIGLPMFGESLMTQLQAAVDMLTLKGASGMASKYVNFETSAGVSKFSVDQLGNVTAAGNGVFTGYVTTKDFGTTKPGTDDIPAGTVCIGDTGKLVWRTGTTVKVVAGT